MGAADRRRLVDLAGEELYPILRAQDPGLGAAMCGGLWTPVV